MLFKKMATATAAAALLLAGTANAAQSLSLANSPVAATVSKKSNKQFGAISPLFIIGGILGTLVILEVTGAIDIIEDSDSP